MTEESQIWCLYLEEKRERSHFGSTDTSVIYRQHTDLDKRMENKIRSNTFQKTNHSILVQNVSFLCYSHKK